MAKISAKSAYLLTPFYQQFANKKKPQMTFLNSNFRTGYCFVVTILLTSSTAVSAFTTLLPDRFAFSIGVAPRVSTIGAPRNLFANGCTGPVTLDETAVATTATLVMRSVPESVGCVERTVVLSYTPRSAGTIKLVMKLPDGSIVAEVPLETVASARSAFNLDGMWFDQATNGSGISFHHAVSSDTVFGTWFLYGASNTFAPRWYSLQNMQWTQGGTLLTGVAYEPAGSGLPLCVAGDDCPRPAVIKPVGSVTVSVIDQNNMRVEAFDQYGRSAFVSSLKRLAF